MRRTLLVTAALLSCSPLAARGGAVTPLAPGLYCSKQHIAGYTGTGHDYDLGNFLMSVEVKQKRGHYAVSFSNQMRDNSEILEAETDDARVLTDGSLAFRFTDGWNNEGKARVYRTGKVILVITRHAPMNQIGRNYGEFVVSKAQCRAPEFRG